MNIVLDADNYFNSGWLTRFVGLPRKMPMSTFLRETDLAAFYDGWDMCDETSPSSRIQAYYKMIKQKQLSAFWVDDHGEEIEE